MVFKFVIQNCDALSVEKGGCRAHKNDTVYAFLTLNDLH